MKKFSKLADFLNLVVFSIFDHVTHIFRIFKVNIRNLRTRFTLYTEFRGVLPKLEIWANLNPHPNPQNFDIFEKSVDLPETKIYANSGSD